MGGWYTERVNMYLVYRTRKYTVSTTGAVIIQYLNIELSSSFFLEYRDKLAASIRDNHFREFIEFLYII